MLSRVLVLAVTISVPGVSLVGSAGATPKENAPSTEAAPLDRVGYRSAPGAQVLGDPVVRPGSDDVAFFEQTGAATELVVCLHGAEPARWPLPAQASRLRIFWTGPTELSLGTEILAPKMIVRWRVTRG